MTAQEMADRCIEHLTKPEVQAELARHQAEINAYFKALRKSLRPTWEDLHRPFDI